MQEGSKRLSPTSLRMLSSTLRRVPSIVTAHVFDEPDGLRAEEYVAIEIVVRDTGCGIFVNVIVLIFTMFTHQRRTFITGYSLDSRVKSFLFVLHLEPDREWTTCWTPWSRSQTTPSTLNTMQHTSGLRRVRRTTEKWWDTRGLGW